MGDIFGFIVVILFLIAAFQVRDSLSALAEEAKRNNDLKDEEMNLLYPGKRKEKPKSLY